MDNTEQKIGYLGAYYNVGELIAQYPLGGRAGDYFTCLETISIWMWDIISSQWVDTNRVDSGLKGYVTDPLTFVPEAHAGIASSYLYVISAEDIQIDPTAKTTTVTFNNFKNGSTSISVTVGCTSVIMLVWNGTTWQHYDIPMRVDLSYLDAELQKTINNMLGSNYIPDLAEKATVVGLINTVGDYADTDVNWRCTNFISCKPQQEIVFNGYTSKWISAVTFYDATQKLINVNVLSEVTTNEYISNKSIIAPDNTVYVRVTIMNPAFSAAYIKQEVLAPLNLLDKIELIESNIDNNLDNISSNTERIETIEETSLDSKDVINIVDAAVAPIRAIADSKLSPVDIEEDIIALVTDSEGNAAVTWSEENGLDANKLSDNLKPTVISDIKDIDQDVVAIVTDSAGNVAVSWTEQDGLDATKLSPRLSGGSGSSGKNMEQWRELGIGLFIHWGVYSAFEGIYNGQNIFGETVTYDSSTDPSGVGAEWILKSAKIPDATYKAKQSEFNSTAFSPDELCYNAALAGMNYVVITVKHHEGFCLFDYEHNDWDITSTPADNNVIDKLKEACDKYGLKFGIYFSQNIDWLAEGGFGQQYKTEDNTDPYNAGQHKSYVENQIKIMNYAVERFNPYILWYDIPTGIDEYPELIQLYKNNELLSYPNVIVNDRLASSEGGDYATGEGNYYFGDRQYSESVFTTNRTWGYASGDDNSESYLPATKMIYRYILESLCRGQNILLNVGPEKNGAIPQLFTNLVTNIHSYIKKFGSFGNSKQATFGYNPTWGRMLIKDNVLRCYVMDNNPSIRVQGVRSELIKSVKVYSYDGNYTISSYTPADNGKSILINNIPLISTYEGYPVVVDIEFSNRPMVIDYPTYQDGYLLSCFSFNIESGHLISLQGVEEGSPEFGGFYTGKISTIFKYGGSSGSRRLIGNWVSASGVFTLNCTLTRIDTGDVINTTIDSTTKSSPTFNIVSGVAYKLEIEKQGGGTWFNPKSFTINT